MCVQHENAVLGSIPRWGCSNKQRGVIPRLQDSVNFQTFIAELVVMTERWTISIRDTKASSILDAMTILTGVSEAWYRAWFGFKRSQVQILHARPISKYGVRNIRATVGSNPIRSTNFHMGRYTVKETVQTVNLTLKSSLGSLPRLPTVL